MLNYCQSTIAAKAGVRLLSPRTIGRIFEVQSHTVDLVMGIPLRREIGYGLLPLPDVLPFLPEGRVQFPDVNEASTVSGALR